MSCHLVEDTLVCFRVVLGRLPSYAQSDRRHVVYPQTCDPPHTATQSSSAYSNGAHSLATKSSSQYTHGWHHTRLQEYGSDVEQGADTSPDGAWQNV